MTQEEYLNQPCGVEHPIVAIHWYDNWHNYVDYVRLTNRYYSKETNRAVQASAKYYGSYMRESYATIDYVEIVLDMPKDVIVTDVTEGSG